MFDSKKIKNDFPILKREFNGKPLVFLDNAATTQKPRVVIDELVRYYEELNSNVHRGIYRLSEEATGAYESSRNAVAKFINAGDASRIIFTRNATEAINLVAYSYGETNIESGDEILVSGLEHHSNLIPWQQLAKRKKAHLKIMPLNDDGTINMEKSEKLFSKRTKIVAVTQVSNVLGVIAPLSRIINLAHARGAVALVDGAQGVGHMGIDVSVLGCDFLAFSAHKMLGPTGVGVLYGKSKLLQKMDPLLFGGEMIKEVSYSDAKWNDPPYKFEAGTPNIADIVAFRKAIEYLQRIGLKNVLEHDRKLLSYGRKKLSSLPDIILYGPDDPLKSTGILSFNIPGVHPHDVGTILDSDGIAIRVGNHCAQPLVERLGSYATARMSFYIYNNEEDIDRVYRSLKKVYKIFHGSVR